MEIKPIKSAFEQQGIDERPNFFGIEIPSINSLKDFITIIELSKRNGIPLSQVNEVLGARLIPRTELKEMLALAKEEKIGLTFSTTSRPEYDIDTAFYRTGWGREQGRRLNSKRKIQNSIDEVHMLVELGCRGIIIYDIGLLRALNLLKINKELPSSLIIKISSHCGVTNHLTAQIHVENGANDIIPMHDISLSSLLDIRKAIPSTPLSVIIDTYITKGGFIRLSDLTYIIEKLSPIYFKMGNSIQNDPYSSNDNLESRIRRIRGILDNLPYNINEYNLISTNSLYKAIPE